MKKLLSFISLVAVILPSFAFAAPALVQTVQGNGGGYVNVSTMSATLAAGNMATLCLVNGAADTETISDNRGDTWNIAKQQILTSQRQATLYYAMNVTGGATTITIQAGAGQFQDTARLLQEWSGIVTTGALDKTVGANTTSGTTYASGNTATTAQANELLIGCIGADSNTPAYTGDAAWTNLLTQPGFDSFTSAATQYRNVSATGAYGWTLTNASSRQASQAVATFKASGAATLPAPVVSTFINAGTLSIRGGSLSIISK